MKKPYEVHRINKGIAVWLRDGIQTFSDLEALELVKTILEKVNLDKLSDKEYSVSNVIITTEEPVAKHFHKGGILFNHIESEMWKNIFKG